MRPVTNALISNNVVGPIDPYIVNNVVTGMKVILIDNRQPNGSPVPGL